MSCECWTEIGAWRQQLSPPTSVILLSGRESDSHGYSLIRKPFQRSDLQRVVAEQAGTAKGH